MKITLLSGKTFDINADLGFDMKVVHSGRSRRLTLRIDKKRPYGRSDDSEVLFAQKGGVVCGKPSGLGTR